MRRIAPAAQAGVGVWLMAAPHMLALPAAVSINYRIVGPLIVACALLSLWQTTAGFRLGATLLAAWLCISSAVLAGELTAAANTLLCGLATLALSAARQRFKERVGGGWRVLLGTWRPGGETRR